jgi:large subunit ribosomal protein L23
MARTDTYRLLLRPIVTERSTQLKESRNQHVFEVALDATKAGIKREVEQAFQVKVRSVRTMVLPGKTRRMGRTEGRRADVKKAIVTLAAGQTIDLAGGGA